MPITAPTPVRSAPALARATQDWLRCVVLLLAACLVMQGLAVSARRALGPGHYHLRSAVKALPAEALPHSHPDSALPFGGRLRAHPAPDMHGAVDYRHSHAATTPGVVTVAEDGSAPGFAAWTALLRSALDLPALQVVPLAPALSVLATHSLRRAAASAAFATRSTAPPLRPPRR